MEKPVIIFGANALGRAVLEIFQSRDVVVYCFLDEDESLHGKEIDTVTVMGSPTDDGFLKYIGKKCEAFVAVESPEKRLQLVKVLNERRKVMPVNAIHDKAIVATSAELGYGNFINAGAVIGAGVKIPSHCVVHSNATIETNVELKEHVQLGTGSIIGANAKIEGKVLVGSGAIIGPGLTIGEGAQIAPGAVVMRDVQAGKTVVGNPAQEI